MTGTSAPAPLEALRELRSQVVAERACFQSLHPVSLGEDPGVGLLGPKGTAVATAHIPASGRTGGCPPTPPPGPRGPSDASASSAQSLAQTADGAGEQQVQHVRGASPAPLALHVILDIPPAFFTPAPGAWKVRRSR